MSTTILASDVTQNQSADIVLADGEVANLVAILPAAYNGPEDSAIAYVQWKTAGGAYISIGRLSDNFAERTVKLSDAGTYRVYREAQRNAIGVERG